MAPACSLSAIPCGPLQPLPRAPTSPEDGCQTGPGKLKEQAILDQWQVKKGKGYCSTAPQDELWRLNTREKTVLDVHHKILKAPELFRGRAGKRP